MKTLIFVSLVLFLNSLTFLTVNSTDFDPYDVLGVSRRAGADEIRKTYKKLAREWHPDKNRAAEASDKFTEINKAYEILGDEKRKDQYDRFGTIENSGRQQQGGQFFRTPFGDFTFTDGGFGGNQNANKITERFLQNRILPESHEKPYFFFATTDFCFNCMRVQPIWQKFTEDLEALDLGFGVIDVDNQFKVVDRLHISSIPAIGAVVDGRSILFSAEEYSVNKLRQFARKLLPDDLVVYDDIDKFLSGWRDNKVRIVFFGTHGLPSLRLLISLYQVKARFLATYIDITLSENTGLVDRFDVENHLESLFIFKEDTETPVYEESKKQFTTSDVLAIFKSHKYLILPRLSDPAIYDDLCPPNTGTGAKVKKYCVMLTFTSEQFSREEVKLFRDFVSRNSRLENVKFMYAFSDIQQSLCSVWKRPKTEFQIAVISRREGYDTEISWLDWCIEGCHNTLDVVVGRLQAGHFDFESRSIRRYDVRDELAGGLFFRILKRLRDWWDHFTYQYFDGDHSLTLMSIISTTVCILIMVFLFKLLGNQSVESNATKPADSASKTARQQPPVRYTKDPGKFTIYDLRSHNYDKLIKEALSGYRLLLLFVDTDNKQQYIRRFADLMMPFNRTPYFIFGFVYIDKYLNWYQRVLAQTVGAKDEFRNIRAHHCVGTVLAINGYRKYYNIYHPKTLNLDNQQAGGYGAFIGLDDSSDSDSEGLNGHAINGINDRARPVDGDALLAQGRILDGLGHWVDRLFDGSLPKCKVGYWPLFPVDKADSPSPNAESDESKKDQ